MPKPVEEAASQAEIQVRKEAVNQAEVQVRKEMTVQVILTIIMRLIILKKVHLLTMLL